MEENRKLRRYLLSRFLITLVLIGITQLIVDGILGVAVLPYFDQALQLDGLLSANDVRQLYKLIFQILIVFIGRRFLPAYISAERLSDSFGNDLVEVINKFSGKMTAGQTVGYIAILIGCLLLVVIIWLLPYMIGGSIFAKAVTKKVDELELRRKERDRELEKQKSLLLSDVAHDIKTPITTMAGFSKALSDGEVDEEHYKEYLDTIYRKSMQVSDLVTLLFEYVKLDSAGYEMKKTTEDFCELVRGCIARMYTEFEEKDMSLEIDIPETGIYLKVDRMQMERAINNLLTNTLKHNPEGTLVFADVKIESGYAVFRLSDKGVLIEREIARHLFEPFVQGDSSRTAGSGSGLGLSITKKIVELHSGRIRLIQYLNVEKYGKVKTFEIKLPLISAN